jgi:hypothetical protein
MNALERLKKYLVETPKEVIRKHWDKTDPWEYGHIRSTPARRHKLNGNVQFILWHKGDQKNVDGIGHTEDKWIDFEKSWWNMFVPNQSSP